MSVLLCLLLWSLVEVHSQTEVPYVSFRGETLPNHGYVDLTLVGDDTGDPGNTVRCHTDLNTCCSVILRVHIVETGISLMELLDCHSLVIYDRLVDIRELTYVVRTMLTHQLV